MHVRAHARTAEPRLRTADQLVVAVDDHDHVKRADRLVAHGLDGRNETFPAGRRVGADDDRDGVVGLGIERRGAVASCRHVGGGY